MILNPIVSDESGRKDIFSVNLENRIVLLTGEIDDEMASSIISQLLYLDSTGDEKICLYINSPGGSVSAGLAIYDTMRSLKSKVSTICIGRAASMAAVILSGGESGERVALSHSEIMIHQPSGGMNGQAEDIVIAAEHIKKVRSELNTILSDNCSRPVKEIAKATDRDHWMDAKEAIEFGIVDRIL